MVYLKPSGNPKLFLLHNYRGQTPGSHDLEYPSKESFQGLIVIVRPFSSNGSGYTHIIRIFFIVEEQTFSGDRISCRYRSVHFPSNSDLGIFYVLCVNIDPEDAATPCRSVMIHVLESHLLPW